MRQTAVRPLQRILGIGFGLVMVFGTMVGVGILRLPGTVAAALGDRTLIMVAWVLGGLYALMGAVSISELAAMIPEAGGFRVYARRAFGEGIGFAVGWIDWLACVTTVSYVAVTAVAFLGNLWPAVTLYPRSSATLIISVFTAIHWFGLRIGSAITTVVSVAGGVTLMILIAGCFVVRSVSGSAVASLATSAASLPLASIAMVFAMVPALRAVLTAYDGWYAPIYMAEENADPGRSLPRAIIGGTLLVVALYLLVNVGLLRVLPLHVLAASDLPAAEAAKIILPRGGSEFVTVISILVVLSLLNTNLLMGPRVLFSIGRDGLFTERATVVSKGGTPRVALALTSVFAVAHHSERLVRADHRAVCGAFAVVLRIGVSGGIRAAPPSTDRCSGLIRRSVTRSRLRSCSWARIAFLVAAIAEDPRSGLIAVQSFLRAVFACVRVDGSRPPTPRAVRQLA
jgi:APA family basic amino acid/polyamine antiporter